jgi:vacuolar-type H+-ATPase subunit H
MASGSEQAPSRVEDTVDNLPRTEVDIEAELEALRDFVVKGGPVLMHHRNWLDLDEFEARLEHVVALLPKEVRRARRVCREEQRIIQDAKDEARRLLDEARAEAEQIVNAAQEEAERLVESSAIRQRALEQAEATIAQAQATAAQIRENSYAYAQQVVGNVIDSLRRLTQTVERDREQLEQNPPDAE